MILDTLGIKKQHLYPKVDANYPVVVLTADGPVEGETKHISTQEAFVRCRDPLRLWDIASVSIEVSKHDSLVAEAEVVWSNRYGVDDEISPRGMVLRFVSLNHRDKKRLRDVVDMHLEKKRRVSSL